uniref:Uncharacterized protein n=1 Tax=Magallana gigas TaxID=29159 RepID=K1PLK7_MAGGI
MSVGPVIIDETPPLCINKPTTELANGLVVASWSSDDFEDNEQIGIIRKIYYRLGKYSSPFYFGSFALVVSGQI